MPDARSPFRNQERKAVGDWWGWGSVSAKPCFLEFPFHSDHQANSHPIQPQDKSISHAHTFQKAAYKSHSPTLLLRTL